jgi:indolepyruvate decarboxylase
MADMQSRIVDGPKAQQPLGHFLFSFLRDQGVRHCFGIPGDYILPLFKVLEQTEGIEAVVTTHEPCAAFSADAYGRYTGLGVLLLTYGVGGFNAMNGVAGAYAESSPLLVISGGPRRGSGSPRSLFTPETHHAVKHLSSQLEAYGHITDLAQRIESPGEAAAMIRQSVRHAMRAKLPVYLEIPTDMLMEEIPVPAEDPPPEAVDSDTLDEAVSFFIERLHGADDPVLIAGAEVGRYGLQREIRELMTARNMPVATSVLGKGLFDEKEPGILGVYAGVISQNDEMRRIVESADLVLMIGVKVTDVNCGAFTANLRKSRLLVAKSGHVGDGYMRFSDSIPLDRFVKRLAEKIAPMEFSQAWPIIPMPDLSASEILMDRYLSVIDKHLDEQTIVIADTGDACYGSLFMTVRRENGYLAPTFYNTMGFSVPAALGVQLAEPASRPIVLVGDGAFQMTGLEFSTLLSRGLNPVIIVFNNSGYGMQRIFVDGRFNDIRLWDYTRIVDFTGGGQAFRVENDVDMERALQAALRYEEGPSLIEAVVPKGELSTGLATLGKALVREKTGACPLKQDGVSCRHENSCAFCRATIWK